MHFFYSRIEPLFRLLSRKQFNRKERLFRVLSRKQFGVIVIILHGFSHRILSTEFRKQRANIKRAWEGSGPRAEEWTAVRKCGMQIFNLKLCMYGWSSLLAVLKDAKKNQTYLLFSRSLQSRVGDIQRIHGNFTSPQPNADLAHGNYELLTFYPQNIATRENIVKG